MLLNEVTKGIYEHFRSAGHSENNMTIRIIERINAPSESVSRKSRLEAEDFCIRTLNTAAPWGLNIKISGYGNVTESLDPLTTKNHPYFGIKLPRVTRGHGKRRRTNKVIQDESLSHLETLANCELATTLGYYVEFRKLSKKLLKHLLKIINDGCAPAFLNKNSNFFKFFITYISGYFLQHEKRMDRNVYYLPFIYQSIGTEKLKFHNIFKDRSLLKLLPIERKLLPSVIISYKFESPISLKLYNYKNFLDSLDFGMYAKFDCDCLHSKYLYKPVQHVVTGNLNIISCEKLRHLFQKGTKYRPPKNPDWDKINTDAYTSLLQFITHLHRKFKLSLIHFQPFIDRFRIIIRNRIKFLRKHFSSSKMEIFDQTTKLCLQNLHNKYIVVPADKAANNYVFICKKYYLNVLTKELGIEMTLNGLKIWGNMTYQESNEVKENILHRHKTILKSYKFKYDEINEKLGSFYFIPKLHKNPYGYRFITSAKNTTMQELSISLHKILKSFRNHFQKYCNVIKERTGRNLFWSINNSNEVINILNNNKLCQNAKIVASYDFANLFTTLPHDLVKKQLFFITDKMFENSGKLFIAVTFSKVFYTNHYLDNVELCLNVHEVKELISILLEENFIMLGKTVIMKQICGIPQGSAMSPMTADLVLLTLEYQYLSKRINFTESNQLIRAFRYIDDVLVFSNTPVFETIACKIYPTSLSLTKTNEYNNVCNYLDMRICLNPFYITLFNKTDEFPFNVQRYTYADSNVHSSVGIRVYKTQILRIARICSRKEDFIVKIKDINKLFKIHGFKHFDISLAFLTFFKGYLTTLLKYGIFNCNDLISLHNAVF